jgi:hypothetical protein
MSEIHPALAALTPTCATPSKDHGQIRSLLDFLGAKWGLLLVILLAQHPYRFGEIRKLVPEISQRMLTEDSQWNRHPHGVSYPPARCRIRFDCGGTGFLELA